MSLLSTLAGFALKTTSGPIGWITGLLGPTGFRIAKYLLIAAALGFVTYKAYSFVYDHAETKVTSKYKDRVFGLEVELKNKMNEITAIRRQRDEEVGKMASLVQDQVDFNKVGLQDMVEKIKDARSRIDSLARLKPKEVVKYVSQIADSNCVIPNGFVFLYDKAIGADARTSESKAAAIAFAASGPGNVDSSSGVTLSEVAENATENFREAADRGAIIQLWQGWYVKTKEYFDTVNKKYNILLTIPSAP